jgi:hypothetical protein
MDPRKYTSAAEIFGDILVGIVTYDALRLRKILRAGTAHAGRERNRVAQRLEKIPQDARIKSAGGPDA